MGNVNVLYYSCPFDLSGYGMVSRNHLLGMYKKPSLNIRLRTKKFWSGVSPDLKENGDILKSMERNPIDDKNFIVIEHLTPENFYIDPRAKYHICYTPFETNAAPSSWLLPLRGMDEIWVPSKHNKESYVRAGLKSEKIKVIPHGVDSTRFNPGVTPLNYERGGFNIGSIFDWTERKNPVALIRAYYNAFYRGEDVSLTIRSFWRFPVEKTREYITSEISRIKEGYNDRKEFPRINFWFDTMNEDIMPNFYKSFDCFALPTRGEGFGLPLLEAMACGVPTIGPKWGGNTEFMTDDNSYLVGGNVVPIDNGQFLRMQPQYAGQSWFDINESELSQTMRRIYDNRDEASEKASVAVKDITEKFPWTAAVNKITNRLMEIDGETN